MNRQHTSSSPCFVLALAPASLRAFMGLCTLLVGWGLFPSLALADPNVWPYDTPAPASQQTLITLAQNTDPHASPLGNFLQLIINSIAGGSGAYTPSFYGAKCDGMTDDAAALNKMSAAITSAGGNVLISMPPGQTCTFQSPVTLPNASNVSIFGNGATLLYTGTSTTSNLVTWGNNLNSCSAYNNVIYNLTITSATTMTAGDAFDINGQCQFTVFNLHIGDVFHSHTFQHTWNSLHVTSGCGLCHIYGIQATAQNIAGIFNGGTTAQITDWFEVSSSYTNSAIGMEIGGNCGGCQWDNTDAVNNTTRNVLIDEGQVPVHNNQVRFGPLFASDGGPPVGIELNDPGVDATAIHSGPLASAAISSFIATATSIPVTTCPALFGSNWYAFDRSTTPPMMIGAMSGCSGTTMTLASPGAAVASAGSMDSLWLSPSPGPGRTGASLFFEGSWVSTAPGICLQIDANVNYAIHLMGTRIEDCTTAGVVNNSDQIRMYVAGGEWIQDGYALENNAAGAHIELQARPSMSGNTGVYGGSATITPSILSGCGGSGAQVFPSDDYDFRVSWGTSAGTSCTIAYSYAHDSAPQSLQVTALGLGTSPNSAAATGITPQGATITFTNNMSSGNQFSIHSSGYGF